MHEVERFEVGERIEWKEPETKTGKLYLRKFRKLYGNGPFLVTYVREVDDCKAHPQSVFVRVDEDLRKALPFSGVWFRHVRH